MQVIRAGLTNISGLFANCRVEDIIEEMTLSKENAYHMCDTQTRKTGKLVKQIVIFDMANVGWIMPSTELVSSQNKASEIAKHLYPQLLDKVVIINAPWFMSQLWKVAKMVLSESLTGKVAMCSGSIVPDGMSGNRDKPSHFFPSYAFQKLVLMLRRTLRLWTNSRPLWVARVESACRAAWGRCPTTAPP